MDIFIEAGKKKVFVGALDWPGWCRFGKDEPKALEAFLAYGERYANVLKQVDIVVNVPQDSSELNIMERHPGNASTNFGAPAAVLAADQVPINTAEYIRSKQILQACWEAFDAVAKNAAAANAVGYELKKGPRGGGRDLEKITEHVVEADRQYLMRMATPYKRTKGSSAQAELPGIRSAILQALETAERGELPTQGPRGGVIWLPRYFVRRVAWHVLDHAWEIEDRLIQ